MVCASNSITAIARKRRAGEKDGAVRPQSSGVSSRRRRRSGRGLDECQPLWIAVHRASEGCARCFRPLESIRRIYAGCDRTRLGYQRAPVARCAPANQS